MRLQRFRQVAAHADDLAASRAFYEDVLGAHHVATYGPLMFFDFAGVRLLLEENAPRSVLYFWVDDIEAGAQELERKGVTLDSPPHRIFADEAGTFGPAGEEEWMAFFKDPGGNTLALATRRAL
jgi:methylmalonyl-CoA/ethylmalonyl-CoA epimerase